MRSCLTWMKINISMAEINLILLQLNIFNSNIKLENNLLSDNIVKYNKKIYEIGTQIASVVITSCVVSDANIVTKSCFNPINHGGIFWSSG